jgi:hypothetical protein
MVMSGRVSYPRAWYASTGSSAVTSAGMVFDALAATVSSLLGSVLESFIFTQVEQMRSGYEWMLVRAGIAEAANFSAGRRI